jgi:hypothetical protein
MAPPERGRPPVICAKMKPKLSERCFNGNLFAFGKVFSGLIP